MSHQMNRRVTLSVVALIVAGLGSPASGAENRGTMAGVVKTVSGEPAMGALVRVRHEERGISFYVVSREQGRYKVSDLPPGEYTVKATGGGYANDSKGEAARVSGTETVTMNLTLNLRRSAEGVMTSADYAKLMPEEGATKNLIVSKCTLCHAAGLRNLVVSRKGQDSWEETIKKMLNHPYGYRSSAELTSDEAMKITDYLAKHFGPDRPALAEDRDVPQTWILGEAAKFMVTEYDLPRGAAPHDVAVDSQGIGWVGEDGHGVIGRFDPQTLTYTRIAIPIDAGESKPSPHAVAVDRQDRIWVPDGPNSRIVQYDPRTQQFIFYPIPKVKVSQGGFVNTIRFHPDGSVWMTAIGRNQVMRLDPITKKVTEYPVPTGVRTQTNTHPYGMAIDGNQWLWFAQEETNKVGRVEPKSGEITEYDVPTPKANLKRMGSDSAGNVWLASYLGYLVKIDYRTGKMIVYPTPTPYSGSYSVDVDTKRNLIWVSEFLAHKLARFDPQTNHFVEYPFFSNRIQLRKIAVDPSKPSRVWFGGYRVDTVGYLDVIE